jgi:predicted deacylase
MKHLGMLPGTVEAPPRYLYTKGPILPLRNRRGGIWETDRHLGDSVEKDGVIGRIIGLANDEVREVVVAPFDGILFDIRVWPIAYPGELLGHFAAGEVKE